MPTIIHLVDDDAGFRAAISRLLSAAGYDVAAFGSARELLEQLPQAHVPGCILLDVQLPDLTGPELQEKLIALGLELPVIFLTGYGDVATSVQTIKAGADDFLVKPVPARRLLTAITAALARHRVALEEKAKSKSLRDLVGALTPREREVFELVVQGRMNKQIARQLGTTERTIKAHRRRIMEKIKVSSLAQLVIVAERSGIRPDSEDMAEVRSDHEDHGVPKDTMKMQGC